MVRPMSEWTNVVAWIDGAAIGKWKPRYENRDILDGTFWRLELLNGTNVVARHSGANAWPKRFWSFMKVKRFALGSEKPAGASK